MAKSNSPNVRPLGDRVLVKPDTLETTKGGIVLPDSVKDDCRTGTIVALGTGKLMEAYLSDREENLYFDFPDGVEVGAKVIYGRYARVDTKTAGGDVLDGHIIVRVDDIIGVIAE
jgi:chaperonin GroES